VTGARRALQPYAAVVGMRFRMLLQYRAAALAGLWTQLVFGLVLIMIYEAFYRSSSAEFTLIDVRLGADGKGVGKVVPAGNVTFDPTTMSFDVEDYAAQPVRLTDVSSSKGVRALNSTL